MTDKEALKEIARQEKRFAAAGCGSSYAKATEDRTRAGAFAVVEIDDEQARFYVYSRAVAEEPDGRVVITARPRRLFVRKISLR